MDSGRAVVVAVVALAVVTSGQRAQAQPSSAGPGGPGWVLSHQKISVTEGGFTGNLDNHDVFGFSVASLGDLDGDGAVGVSDLLSLLASLGPCKDCPADFDGNVGVSDLLTLLGNWGPCP